MAWYPYFHFHDDDDDITKSLAYDYINELLDTTFALCNDIGQNQNDEKFNICFRILTKIVILSKLSSKESNLQELQKLTKELNIDSDLKQLIKMKQ